ncbi:MAG: hypothetical protein HC828_09140, partial [Blastochloris sp.]|nr:hypothetical protein [Blastochloris sp.]
MVCGPQFTDYQQAKVEQLGAWIAQTWVSQRPDEDWLTVWAQSVVTDGRAMTKFNPDFILDDGYRFAGAERVESLIIVNLTQVMWDDSIAEQAGAFIYRFVKGDETVEVMVTASFFNDDPFHHPLAVVACIPRRFTPAWTSFEGECTRLVYALNPEEQKVF